MAEIQREIINDLKAWKENPHHKPYILQKAAQSPTLHSSINTQHAKG